MSRLLMIGLVSVFLLAGCNGGDDTAARGQASPENAEGAVGAAKDEIELTNQADWKTYYGREHKSIRDEVSFDDFSSCMAAIQNVLGQMTVSNLSAKHTDGHFWDVEFDGVLSSDPKRTTYHEVSSYGYDKGQWWFTTSPSQLKLWHYGKDCVQHLSELSK